jgi:hypothetical protein
MEKHACEIVNDVGCPRCSLALGHASYLLFLLPFH